MEQPHVVAPDIGTSSSLFAASTHPGRFRSLVVGSGGAAVPVDVTGALKDWVESSDLEPYIQLGGRKIVEIAIGTMEGYVPPAAIREDYITSYDGDRFAQTVPYAQSYLDQLPLLADLLERIQTPVRIIQGDCDRVVPPTNAHFLRDRLPHSHLDFIEGAGHFCWEERPEEYAALVIDWWREHSGTTPPDNVAETATDTAGRP
jgi:pimeloyl-ACP methyl ester carboxylesterase